MILGIETSSQVSSVAVVSDKKIVAEISTQTRFTHSETLLENIANVLKIAEVSEKDLKAIAVSIGPGSFTGLRIGLASAKSLAYAWKIPIIGVPTTEALAFHFFNCDAEIWQLIDAQKNSACLGRFSTVDGIPKSIDEIKILPIVEILERAKNSNRNIILQGEIVNKKIEGKIDLPSNIFLAPINLRMPRASCVAIAGFERLNSNRIDNVMNLEPLYLRRSEAEELFERRANGN